MPLTLDDAVPLAKAAVPVLRSIARSLSRKSEGGRKITREEAREIGEKLAKLASAFAAEALD